MSDEYTPTTVDVRDRFVAVFVDSDVRRSECKAFDRWLAAHDAEVLATRKDSLTVRTVAELDALPEGTRAIDATQTLLIARHWSETMGRRNWASMSTGGVMGSIFSDVVMLPATVLWTPEETGQ